MDWPRSHRTKEEKSRLAGYCERGVQGEEYQRGVSASGRSKLEEGLLPGRKGQGGEAFDLYE